MNSSFPLDLTQDFDINSLDAVINQFYHSSGNDEVEVFNSFLTALKDRPDMFNKVEDIISSNVSSHTKFFALKILEDVCRFKWGSIQKEQRKGICNFVCDTIIKFATDETTFIKERIFLNKLNIILVQIVKHDWPNKWPTFISDIIKASQGSETLCENSIMIFKLLSEEIYHFSKDQLGQAKMNSLKSSLCTEFLLIHDLCYYVMGNSRKNSLLNSSLLTLHSYLGWLPPLYIIDSGISQILQQFFIDPAFRNNALYCLNEICLIDVKDGFDSYFVQFYTTFTQSLNSKIIHHNTDIQMAYSDGTKDDHIFIQNLALFFTQFLNFHISSLERQVEHHDVLLNGMEILMKLTLVNDIEIFKICLDFWRKFSYELYIKGIVSGSVNNWRVFYNNVIHAIRVILIQRMAKPEEIFITVDDNGLLVREVFSNLSDNLDILVRHNSMKETLKYLTYLDFKETHQIMIEKITLQINGQEWGWDTINALCWAIGAISGSVKDEAEEDKFLVSVIKDLLILCEKVKWKDNKAIVASNIMYVVGQYPRFLNNNWKFLKTVVYKLFEFMHECHPGIKDMACDTFLKIARSCTRRFIVKHYKESCSFIEEILSIEEEISDLLKTAKFQSVIQDLNSQQRHRFYQSISLIIKTLPDDKEISRLFYKLMEPINSRWDRFSDEIEANFLSLMNEEKCFELGDLIQINLATCISLRSKFLPQLVKNHSTIIKIYQACTRSMQLIISEKKFETIQPNQIINCSSIRQIKSIKTMILRLLETFAENYELSSPSIIFSLIDAFLIPITQDYSAQQTEFKDSNVLSCLSVFIIKTGQLFLPYLSTVMASTFEVTLKIISNDPEKFPDHKIALFRLLQAITTSCFDIFLKMTQEQFSMVMESFMWAIRQTENNLSQIGLKLTWDILNKFSESKFISTFYKSYYLILVHEIFSILTDTIHKHSFKIHVKILYHLFHLVMEPTKISEPLWNKNLELLIGSIKFFNNMEHVQKFVSNLISRSFLSINRQQIEIIVSGMFYASDYYEFKKLIQEFLVLIKVFLDLD
jgi:exportin-1